MGHDPIDTWDEVKAALRDHAEAFSRARVVVFPQVKIASYRVDFLVAVTDRVFEAADAYDGFDLMIVECDGREHHGLESGAVREDLTREADIQAKTGLDFLRFSGAELTYCPEEVVEVMTGYIEARFAHRQVSRARMEHLLHAHDYARGEVQDMVPEMPVEAGRVSAACRFVSGVPDLRQQLQSAGSGPGLKAFRSARSEMRWWLDNWESACPLCDDL